MGESFLIVAGPPADAGHRWPETMKERATPVPGIDFASLHPEALSQIPGSGKVQVLSDDGGVEARGVACKKRPAAEQSFRSVTLQP